MASELSKRLIAERRKATQTPASEPRSGPSELSQRLIAAERARTAAPVDPNENPIDSIWGPHLVNRIASFGLGADQDMPADVATQERVSRGVIDKKHVEMLAKRSKETGMPIKQLERRLLARDAVTAGSLFFAAPTVVGGGGLLGAAAGFAGRAGVAGGMAGAAGEAEGLLGGYDTEERTKMMTDYATVGVGASMGLEVLGGLVGAGMAVGGVASKMGQINKLLKEVNSAPKSIFQHAEGISQTGELRGAEALSKQAEAAREAAKEALKEAGRVVRGTMRRLGKKDFGEDTPAELRAWAIGELRARGHDIPDDIAGDLLYETLRAHNTKMPLKMVPPSKKLAGIQPGLAAQEARTVFDMTLGMPDIGTHYYLPGSAGRALDVARQKAKRVVAEQLEEALGVGRLLNNANDLNTKEAAYGSFKRVIWAGVKKSLQRTQDLLRKTKTFGTAGPALADGMHYYSQLADAAIGHNTRIVDSILKPLNVKQLYQLDEVLRWGGSTSDPAVDKAAKMWVQLRKMFADDTKKLNIHTKDVKFTAQVARLGKDDKKLLAKVMRKLDKAEGDASGIKELEEMSPELYRLFAAISKAEGKLDIVGREIHVIRPFKESALKAPDYFDPKFIEAVRNDESHPIYALLRERVIRQHKELLDPLAGDVFDEHAIRAQVNAMLGEHSGSAPEDIRRNSLQWSKESIIPSEYRISDPRVWMHKYMHEASTRQALAKTFGGRNEVFNRIRQQLMDETHPSVSRGGNFRPRGNENYAEEIFQKIFNMMAGGGERTHGLVKAMNSVATIKMLGFRTAMKQIPALGNSAAVHGLGNTLDAMVLVLKDPRARALADDLGATVQDLQHILTDDLLGEYSQKHLRYTGIVLADRLTRRTSALAAGLKAKDAARRLLKLKSGSPAERLEAEQAFRWFDRLSVDPEKVIAAGGKVSQAELGQIMRAGARNTQFASQVEDLPYANGKSLGKLMLFLSKFGLQHGAFLKNEIYKEAARGNMKPLIGLAVAAGISDQTIGQLLETASKGDYDATSEILQDTFLGKVGALVDDAYNNPRYAVPAALAGPAVGLASDAVVGAIDASKGRFPKTWLPNSARQIWNAAENLSE